MNAFNTSTADIPGLMAAMLLEMATLKAEVRALAELVKNPAGNIDALTLEKQGQAFEELQDNLRNLGVDIPMPPEG